MDYKEIILKTLYKVQNTIKTRYLKGNHIELDKGAFGDIQYDIDILAEETIINTIKMEMPNSTIVSEETGIIQGNNNKIILIDPIDGSLNSIRGIPFFSSTIAIAKNQNFSDIIAAGVVDIIQENFYYGDENGAIMNNVKINPNKTNELKDSLIALDLNIRTESGKEVFKKTRTLFEKTKTQRIMGSAIIENMYVASGKIDAYIAPSRQLRTVDCLPAMYISKIAGASIQFFNKENDFNILSKERVSFINACTNELRKKILNELDIT